MLTIFFFVFFNMGPYAVKISKPTPLDHVHILPNFFWNFFSMGVTKCVWDLSFWFLRIFLSKISNSPLCHIGLTWRETKNLNFLESERSYNETDWNFRSRGISTIYMGYLWPCSIQGSFGGGGSFGALAIRFFLFYIIIFVAIWNLRTWKKDWDLILLSMRKLKIANILKMANHIDYGILHTWGTFDLVAFKPITRSFGALASFGKYAFQKGYFFYIVLWFFQPNLL